jgi:hypothetical protein
VSGWFKSITKNKTEIVNRCKRNYLPTGIASWECENDTWPTMPTIFLIHCAATWALVGLIWVVQIVQYPAFRRVGEGEFKAYHAAHMRNISFIVGPLILTEAGTAACLVLWGDPSPTLLASFVLILVAWASTWFLQIPLHETLARGFDQEAARKLIKTNWCRTIAWTIRGIAVSAIYVS